MSQALEKPADDPVAWCVLKPWLTGKFMPELCFSHVPLGGNVEWVPLYTRPQSTTQWVGLTGEELEQLAKWADEHGHDEWHLEYGRAIEAKLKENNT